MQFDRTQQWHLRRPEPSAAKQRDSQIVISLGGLRSHGRRSPKYFDRSLEVLPKNVEATKIDQRSRIHQGQVSRQQVFRLGVVQPSLLLIEDTQFDM